MRGKLISFEGPDGAGKTTVLHSLLPLLREKGLFNPMVTREPGGVIIGEKIREVILDPSHIEMDLKTELLLYIAARRQHWIEKVYPALEKNQVVLIDRFIDSSIVYQGYGRGLLIDDVKWMNNYATDGRLPDLTLYFDVPSEVGLKRIAQNSNREINRLDLETLELHQKVRAGYLELCDKFPERIRLIDADRDLELVIEETFHILVEYLGK